MERDVHSLISEMTLEEKASLCSGSDFWHLKGIERLGIPSIMVTDGPHGLRKQQEASDHLGLYNSVPATCFPSAVSLASTWNRSLLHHVGVALGEECQAEGVSVLLGPGTNIKRSPLCGRNFEYFSEDPYLSSEMATSHINGVQSQGVGTSLKHFAVNNQEHRRMTVDSVVDERTLREIYLASFEDVVKNAKPWTVMASYNKVNGTYASENQTLLTEILKDEWGFGGIVMSDWGAVNERVMALKAGLELEMPSSVGVGEKKIVAAVTNGELSEEVLNQTVERLLQLILKATDHQKPEASYYREAHHELARKVATESMVLLKNESNILPLKKEGHIAVIGELAVHPRYQGGGSSHINPTQLENSLEEIKKITASGASVTYASGYQLDQEDIDTTLIEEAKQAASQADVVLLFVGLPDRYESEGYDRTHLRLPDSHLLLIDEVTDCQSNVVVVLSNGSPVEMPWLNQVKGVLEAYLGGQASGGAIASLLFGDENPSGKLAETFPKKLSDNPSFLFFPGVGDRVEYNEGVFVGYRYYDTKELAPLFPFGYGLSYTTFEYRDLTLRSAKIMENESLEVSVTIKNTGQQAGQEIVQLYVRDVESSVRRPFKELKGFEKIALAPGEAGTLTFTLDRRAFAFYSEVNKDWQVESGEFEILIGQSSSEIVLSEKVSVEAEKRVTLEKVDRNTTVGDLLADPILGPITKQLMAQMSQMGNVAIPNPEDDDNPGMMTAMMKDIPLRAVVNFSQGAFTEDLLSMVIAQLNMSLTAAK